MPFSLDSTGKQLQGLSDDSNSMFRRPVQIGNYKD
jgi:hypothetical protein